MDHDIDNLRRVMLAQNKAAAANMLADTEQRLGIFASKSVAEGMIRASADWVFSRVGPLTAYRLITAIEDELALRIIERRNAAHRTEPPR